MVGYHVPESKNPDFYALNILRTVLFQGESSRMYQRLVDKDQIALDVSSSVQPAFDPTLAIIIAQPKQGIDPQACEKAIYEELERTKKEPISDRELEKAKNIRLVEFYDQVRTINGRANTIGTYDVFFGDYNKLFDAAKSYAAVTKDDVKRVATAYFGANNRTVATLLPQNEEPAKAMSNASKVSRWFAVLVVLACAPLGMRGQGIHLPPHEKVVLKNGMTVLLMEKHGVPIVSLAAIIKVGAAADPIGQEGLASITAGLLRKGTKTRSAQQFAADLDYIGGTFEAGAGADFTSISGEFLTKDTERGLELFSDALLHPVFPQDETEKLISQSMDAVKAVKDEPRAVLGIYFNGYLYGAQGYGRAEDGDEISLKRIRRDSVSKFYETQYTPGNTILAVAGEFNAAEMKRKLDAAFGGWSGAATKPATATAVAPVKGRRLLLVNKPDATQTYFAIGNVGTAVGDPDRVAIRVVNTIFGGRFTSALNEALRVESGLTYGANSAFDSRKVPGPFAIHSFTKNESTTQAIDLALQVLQKLHKDGVTTEQLASAKAYMKEQFPPSIETSEELARRIAANEFYGLDDKEVNQMEARIDAVTLDTAREAIRKHFPSENLVFVLIGNAASIAPAVKKYAEQQDARDISAPGFWPPPAGASTN